ncbi:helix-turn-helix domain-containing protein [Acinetobacter sp. ANC 4635]|uniref:helix-turn-helix domain-containing protein n=1 Tax=Acinetobacter sp. ANC 4635 TaxID=2529846 RepID=UPI00104094E1|nr:helix-turn-helix domain-containing protein [Acinetobacter sp. ANC 4635]TCB32209.1 helix-turn-helix domain-containing protein [Acinetobacter sp. ANC 4635]
MSLDATRWAWTAPVENCSQRIVLLSLADRAGEDHKAWPSIKRLEVDTKCDRKTIMKVLDRLEGINLIRFTHDIRGNGVKVYQLIGVSGREDDVNTVKKTTSTKIGTSTKNGTATSTKIGTGTSTKNGTQNLPIESTNESINIYKEKFSFYSALLSLGANKKLVCEFMEVRKAKKAVNSETAFKSLISEQQKSGLNLNQVIEHCVVNSWKGFKAEWIKNQNTVHGQQNQKPSRWDEIQQLIAKEEQGNDSYGY